MPRIREIPYNYTSFSDKEIVNRFLGSEAWETLDTLRGKRRTGISARMLFEVLGVLWVVSRNPYIQNDLIKNPQRLTQLTSSMQQRLKEIDQRANGNDKAIQLVELTCNAISAFQQEFVDLIQLRKQLRKDFAEFTRADNVDFGGLARVSHMTDATDWRVELPLVVLTPDLEEEIPGLLQVCIKHGLTLIPRGGGTGYTGGAVPLDKKSAVLNTEKLEYLGAIEHKKLLGNDRVVPVVKAGAGVVTKRVSELAATQQYAFAVDPTSQDASTIGGNIAMNAGGKKAVLWGTTLDNLLSWTMVTPDAEWLKVERLDHNMGKIHEQKEVAFKITRFESDGKTEKDKPETLLFSGSQFRTAGLGKDVTDKFLGGLPGIQKEGCDGLITSAEFILHKMPEHIRTVCLEFYGTDLHQAVPAIVEIARMFDSDSGVVISGLEHLDERYVKAVKYSPKGTGDDYPKMILIADVASDNADKVNTAAEQIVSVARGRDGEGFIASSPQARRQFWLDRSRTAAIAAHTNAFKINEDVVIPLHNLAAYSEQIECINIEQSMLNKMEILTTVRDYLLSDPDEFHDLKNVEESSERNQLIAEKLEKAQHTLEFVLKRWKHTLKNKLQYAKTFEILLDDAAKADIKKDDRIIDLLLRRSLRISYVEQIAEPLDQIFTGRDFKTVREKINSIHSDLRKKRLFIALHMHAGDGNVHTNIPVLSNDYVMLNMAEKLVEQIIKITLSLDGVISGEHGIGITKLQFLDKDKLNSFVSYKDKVDPDGNFNRGKLMPGSGLHNAYTPSLQLLQQEALILEESALGSLNLEIKDCLRCGKCKPVCTTHVPGANLLYSPRDKILGTGLIIEAFLYEEQSRRGISLKHFDALNDIADHCTVCHRCYSPCPVNIDFGNVTVTMRQVLKDRKQRWRSPMNALSMAFLNITGPGSIKTMRKVMIEWGYLLQRFVHKSMKKTGMVNKSARPAATSRKPEVKTQIIRFFDKPAPANIPSQTIRAMLKLENETVVPILRDPGETSDSSDTVFYFPGCGSERLFSQIGAATLAMLYDLGVKTVIPPGYLCCGYPQTAGGDAKKGKSISTQNRVLFHRIANTLNYLDIKTVIVSCGTCMDQLMEYEFEKIFPGCRLLDIHEYLMEKGVTTDKIKGQQYLYHEPCHTPMKEHNSVGVAETLLGTGVSMTDRCCGEAGTFAVSRPDIATQVRFRKQQELQLDIKVVESNSEDKIAKILTSCPACQQGLSRYADDLGVDAEYIVVELANYYLGEDWQVEFVKEVSENGIERVLL